MQFFIKKNTVGSPPAKLKHFLSSGMPNTNYSLRKRPKIIGVERRTTSEELTKDLSYRNDFKPKL